jgi:CheY-like chemotaxis protein
MKGTQEKILNHGFNEYLSKPCTPKTLIETIKKYLADKEKVILN